MGIVALVTVSIQYIFFILLHLLKPIIGEQRVRYGLSFLMGTYLRFVRFFISDFKVILTGDVDMIEKTKTSRCIYIQNHQTELDWLFMCYFLQMFGREDDFSAIMKGSIAKVPAFGPIVQDLNMCLLDRNWTTDQTHFKTFLERFETHPRPTCVFLCPEGTTIVQSSYERSQDYARRTGRPVLEHLLLPRSTGLAFIVQQIREWEKTSCETVYLYDATMQFEGYSGEISRDNYERSVDVNFPDIDNCFFWRVPVTCHLHINVYPLTKIVSEGAHDLDTISKEVQQWLDASWVEKEKQMDYFIKHQTFNNDWNINRKVENFNFPHRLRDSVRWVLVGITAISLEILLMRGIIWTIRSIKAALYHVCHKHNIHEPTV